MSRAHSVLESIRQVIPQDAHEEVSIDAIDAIDVSRIRKYLAKYGVDVTGQSDTKVRSTAKRAVNGKLGIPAVNVKDLAKQLGLV